MLYIDRWNHRFQSPLFLCADLYSHGSPFSLTEGWPVPFVQCIVICNPCDSFSSLRQFPNAYELISVQLNTARGQLQISVLFSLSSCLLFGTWPEILSHLGFPRLSGPSLWCTDIHSHVNFPSCVCLQAFSSQSSETNPRAKLKGQYVRWTTTNPSFDPGSRTKHTPSFFLVMG